MRAGTRVVVAVAAATAAVAVSAAPAQAGEAAARISIFENGEFEPGGPLVLDWGYAPANPSVPSGATVRWSNAGNIDPHTVTVVAARDLPQTLDEILTCFQGVCAELAEKHFTGPEPARLVNVGKAGLNRRGDSRLLFPDERVFARVTAPAGSTLHYMCAFHPWMQAQLRVS